MPHIIHNPSVVHNSASQCMTNAGGRSIWHELHLSGGQSTTLWHKSIRKINSQHTQITLFRQKSNTPNAERRPKVNLSLLTGDRRALSDWPSVRHACDTWAPFLCCVGGWFECFWRRLFVRGCTTHHRINYASIFHTMHI